MSEKVAKIGWSGMWQETLKEDGRGKVQVRFKLQFGVMNASDKYIACEGMLQCRYYVWRPVLINNPPTDLRLQIVMPGARGYSVGRADERRYEHWQQIRVNDFKKGGNDKTFIGVTTYTRPIWLKKDVAEWNYNYELWFPLGFLGVGAKYVGHKSEYWRFDLRG